VSMDTLGDAAIEGMLAHLDPHSVFIPPMDVSEINEDLQGNFQGIGIIFEIFDDTVNVVNVLEGGPSDKAGLQVGDKFLKIEDSVVTGRNADMDRVTKFMRGPGSSKVAVKVLRQGQIHDFTITRGTIPLPSMDA